MKFTPHNYQRYCINRMIQEPALALFLGMGLGKTVTTMTVINDLKYNRFLIRRCLVIAPKKVAEDTWTREQAKWDHLHLLRVVPVLGSLQRRIKALASPGDVYVTNRENVPWLVDYYRNDWPFDAVVIDESSSFKSHQAKRFKALKSVRPHIERIYELTGTPSSNGYMDLWAQIYLLDGGIRLGRTITEYRNNYFCAGSRNATTIFRYDPLPGAEEIIQSRIQDICISLSAEDYLELPDRIDNIRYIKLDAKAQKAYDEMEKQRILEFGDTILDAGSAAVLSNKLLQIGNGAVYVQDPMDPDRKNVVEVHDNKIEAFMELVEELNGEHALVFYNFQHDVERIEKALVKTKLRVGELRTSADIADWNAGKIDILLAHPASAAYGLNLQEGGHHVIWFGLNWSLELYQQANARLHRQGQEQKVFIHHLAVVGSVDEDVMDALKAKGDSQAALLEALKARVDKYR
ncbi:MAG: DEAD/DEAH box helicase [Lachnospiraceae bacterium]|nr:DEAD/DEAH box helicase [Lachnospiraceae bacterium]